MAQTIYQQARIHQIIRQTETTKTFVLQPESEWQYKSGQFMTLLFPKNNQQQEIERRAYSFSSAPEIDSLPAITIKRISNGLASRQLIDDYKVGDRISFSHISGNFTLPKDDKNHQHFMFFAAGSGIVPIFSLIKSILSYHNNWRITLVYSSHQDNDTLFKNELEQLQLKYYHQFEIEWHFSVSETHRSASRLSHFMLLDILKKHTISQKQDLLFYLCGPFEYMEMLQIILQTEGFKSEQIKREHFYIPRSNKAPEPPDKAEREIVLHLNNQIYRFFSKYPDSILSAALKNNVPLDFSCRSGQCGSCVAQCRKGSVWMRYNEVLTDENIQEGMILTCTGFPINDTVELKK